MLAILVANVLLAACVHMCAITAVCLPVVGTRFWTCPSTCGDRPGARDGHSACILNDRMFIFGGYVEDVSAYNSQQVYLFNFTGIDSTEVK